MRVRVGVGTNAGFPPMKFNVQNGLFFSFSKRKLVLKRSIFSALNNLLKMTPFKSYTAKELFVNSCLVNSCDSPFSEDNCLTWTSLFMVNDKA